MCFRTHFPVYKKTPLAVLKHTCFGVNASLSCDWIFPKWVLNEGLVVLIFSILIESEWKATENAWLQNFQKTFPCAISTEYARAWRSHFVWSFIRLHEKIGHACNLHTSVPLFRVPMWCKGKDGRWECFPKLPVES